MGAQAVRLSNVDIDNALKNKDFEVLFQPIFDLGNGALARMEAFVRWRHSGLGVLPPGAFISFFESQGRMSELTRYVLGRALERYLSWRGPYPPGISINLALSDLSDDAFASHLTVLLREHDFPADLITLECPMPPVTASLDSAAANFKRLASTGARLAIEVRGRANDLLREIEPFPFDEIKTGGAAILRFARTVRGPGLSAISELLDIAGHANAAITAVGVEDQASLAALRGLGFTAAQGNHLGRVGPLKDFMPSRVNEVRALLGLEPLSADDLASLFRTGAPTPKPAKKATAQRRALAPPAPPAKTAAGQKPAAKKTGTAPAGAQSDEKETRARKAAAIARAKKKVAAAAKRKRPAKMPEKKAAPIALADDSTTPSFGEETAAARKLQERLSEAFPGQGPEKAAADKPPSPATAAPKAAPPSTDEADANPGADTTRPDDLFDEFTKNLAGDDDLPAAPDKAAAEKIDEEKLQAPAPAKAEPHDSADIETVDVEPVDVEVEEAPADQIVAKADDGTHGRASLAVGRTGAHFRPVMRVGGPPVSSPSAPPRAAPPTDDDLDIVEVFLDDDGPAPTKPQDAPPPEPYDDSLLGDLEETDVSFEEPAAAPDDEKDIEWRWAEEPRAPVRPRRRRKNLLTRRYRLWPDHFWPKSWKRSWRRRMAAKAQSAAEEQRPAEEQ